MILFFLWQIKEIKGQVCFESSEKKKLLPARFSVKFVACANNRAGKLICLRARLPARARSRASHWQAWLITSEIKLISFPKSQFLIKGFSDPFHIDRNLHGGGIFLYVREDTPTKLLSTEPIPSECFFVELNLRKPKWLISWNYNPHKITYPPTLRY